MAHAALLLSTCLLAAAAEATPPAPSTSAPDSGPSALLGPAFQFLPGTPPALAPYLHAINSYEERILRKGALIEHDPLSSAAQEIKTALATIGMRYSLSQAFTLATIDNRIAGDPAIGAYTFEFLGNWTLFHADELRGTSGWVTIEADGGTGLGIDWHQQSPALNAGTEALPNYVWWGEELFIAELAWGQSFLEGSVVVLAGMIDQTNHFDNNAFAGNGFGQLQNESFNVSKVLPLPGNSLGVNVQWQPTTWLYAMLGASTNNLPVGVAPWNDVSADDLSYTGEIGYLCDDLAGLGAGRYRVQPFVATVDGATGGGVACNLQQKLGRDGPFGAFLRAGVGDQTTGLVRGAVAQVAGGLALMAPFTADPTGRGDGILTARNGSYVGLGLAWTQVPDGLRPTHEDEYALELTAALQLTPTATLQPGVQFIWDPAFSGRDTAIVFQLSLNLAW